MAKIKPLHDRILVKRQTSEQKTAGGIIIPDTAQEKTQVADVIEVGNGRVSKDGSVRPLAVKKGDQVLLGNYSGTEVKFNGEEYIILREDEILAIVQ